ncbi:hypothetical protein [Nocardioides sp.]|uniref:hypothetical protein n=1 Tax=Nocardioides sp. TaxID=35761 RepID=UPI003784008B
MRLGIAVLLATLLLGPAAASAQTPIEGYASYDPGTRCHPRPLPGTVLLARAVVHRYGGALVATSRACRRHPTSEHQTGRAFDWGADVRRPADRERVQALLDRLFATDAAGNADAWARRAGVMYVIWNDRMYPAWTHFEPEPYLASSCPTRRRCSATLRHRDHVHVSLSRRGARGLTSWYPGRSSRPRPGPATLSPGPTRS